ncbi:hypothetical protein BN2476_210128 [Paraburkholderia piptadeniae]|uniref:Uncharacterized protein n=1 Tax=Paraburkholderia piptadeniae TaxID=1701573 RepID=A0A1N7RW01_9BURK|nr:hypothetical protein BN2476_210128 [Paraburkholderia piptadeniae]
MTKPVGNPLQGGLGQCLKRLEAQRTLEYADKSGPDPVSRPPTLPNEKPGIEHVVHEPMRRRHRHLSLRRNFDQGEALV